MRFPLELDTLHWCVRPARVLPAGSPIDLYQCGLSSPADAPGAN